MTSSGGGEVGAQNGGSVIVELWGVEEIFEFFEANCQPGIITIILTSKRLNS